jgi:hypothetical protein
LAAAATPRHRAINRGVAARKPENPYILSPRLARTNRTSALVPLPAPIGYAGLGLLADLQTTAEMLLDACWKLERDQACVNAAVQRVFDRTRPSHKREIKDSIHLEHCLELARRVRDDGFAEEIFFASANKNDYGPAVAHQPHADLQSAFDAVHMSYCDSLGAAIARLGI